MPGKSRATASAKKRPRASPAPEAAPPAEDPQVALVALGHKLLDAAAEAPVREVQRLIKAGAPTWYQEETMGWSALHYAAERADADVVRVLLEGGAVWNAMDLLGNTPADISLSVNDAKSYLLIRNEGVRSEMLHHAISASMPKKVPSAGESSTLAHGDGNTMTLRQEDSTSAGDNLTFLKSKLVYDKGEDGKERVLDADGNGVMMGWEEPLMREHVRVMAEERARNGEALNILNVGYGLGIIDRLFQDLPTKPANHVVIEAHPQVLEHIRTTGFDSTPGVKILPGRWQDWICDEKMAEVLALTAKPAGDADPAEEPNEWDALGQGFDVIFVDTFAEGYEDLKAFFEFLPDLLKGSSGCFSFWNGLGATNPTIYDVATQIADLHLTDIGMNVDWHSVHVDDTTSEETWQGVKRKYWTQPVYKLPVARMN